MTREEAKKKAEVMMAFAAGSDVQYYDVSTNKWIDLSEEEVIFHPSTEYRVKPKPTYRPFKDKEECWEEMQKHHPFEWVKQKGTYRQTLTVSDDYICFAGLTLDYVEAFNEVQFGDGTPFGIKEE